MLWPDEKIQLELERISAKLPDYIEEAIPYDKAYFLFQRMRTEYETRLIQVRTEEMERTSLLIEEITEQVERFTKAIQEGQSGTPIQQPAID